MGQSAEKKLQTQFPAHVINNSISGETASGGRNRIEQALKIHRPISSLSSSAAMTDARCAHQSRP